MRLPANEFQHKSLLRSTVLSPRRRREIHQSELARCDAVQVVVAMRLPRFVHAPDLIADEE